MQFMKSVRLRLLVLAILPLAVVLPILLGVTMARWASKFDELLIENVASDLRIAEQYVEQIIATQSNQIEALANSLQFDELVHTSGGSLQEFLEDQKNALSLDYLVIRDGGQQSVLAPEIDIYNKALEIGRAQAIEVFSNDELKQISPKLAVQATIPLIETEAAIHTERTIENRGMIVIGAAKIKSGAGTQVLIGGKLLNQNLQFIDTINDLVYKSENDDLKRVGTATLFLEDVRISTNVRLFENVRALGTRVSEAVYRNVLDDGKTWLDRAFVVNNWYVSGYLPILDGQSRRIGMLYVGFLEEPFTRLKTTTYLALVSAFILVLLLTIPFFLRIARGIFSPLEKMSRTIKLVEGGNLDARISEAKVNGEIGEVARHLDNLLDQVQVRDEKLRQAADELNQRVEIRTQELLTANTQLEATYKQLVTSEKLASIGEITAGVAHEINNPVAVIQGNMELIRAGLEAREDLRVELDLVDEQVVRINSIVGKLLQFARPSEFSETVSNADVASTLEDCIVLVLHAISKSNIEIVRKYGSTQKLSINQVEFQQVIINLLMNAIHAMPKGGVLTLSVNEKHYDNKPGTEICVADNGDGIDPAYLDRIFDPFFTTKKGVGTGLGLSISQSLIQRIGGQLRVESKKSVGTTFLVWIPNNDNLSNDG